MTINDHDDQQEESIFDQLKRSYVPVAQKSKIKIQKSSEKKKSSAPKTNKKRKREDSSSEGEDESEEEGESKVEEEEDEEDADDDEMNNDFSFSVADEDREKVQKKLELLEFMKSDVENSVDQKIARHLKEKQQVEKNVNNETEQAEPESTKQSSSSLAASVHVDTSVKFESFNLSRGILKAIRKMGWIHPTPIQAKTLMIALKGHDICGSAVTGSGKTAAFAIPVIEKIIGRDPRFRSVRALVLSPTRELATQSQQVIEQLCEFTDLTSCLIIGGLSNSQQENMLRKQPDIVVATPGRLIDHLRNAKSVDLDDLEILVLDEADRLLEMGFSQEVEEILRFLPQGRQSLLFSATMTEDVDRLVKLSLKNPVRVSTDPVYNVSSTLKQEFIVIRPADEATREAQLLALCSRSIHSKALLFFQEKSTVHRMKIIFGMSGLNATELHGNLTQLQRLEALEKFREGKVNFLLTTDLAARGLDIEGTEVSKKKREKVAFSLTRFFT